LGFSLFYSVPLGEFEGIISNYTITISFHFLCNSFFFFCYLPSFCKQSFLDHNKRGILIRKWRTGK
jgi:hypothetical protein